MNKRTAITLAVVAGVVVVGYVIYRWWQSRAAAAGGSPTGTFGTNLNSVAPELVGGSSGPSVGPALSAPVNITLNETSPAAAQQPLAQQGTNVPSGLEPGGIDMSPVNNTTGTNPMYAQNGAAQPGVVEGPDLSNTVDTGQEGDNANTAPAQSQPQPQPSQQHHRRKEVRR